MLENNFLSSSCYVVIDSLNINFHTQLPLSFQSNILKMKHKRNSKNKDCDKKMLDISEEWIKKGGRNYGRRDKLSNNGRLCGPYTTKSGFYVKHATSYWMF